MLEIGLIFTSVFMTGVIWFVQIVHYPLFEKVGVEAFVAYEKAHTQRTCYIVVPMMLIELALTGFYCFSAPSLPSITVFLLLLLIWGSTFFLQAPQHQKLTKAYNLHDIQKLVQTNWIRTIAWTLKSSILLLTHHF